MPDLGPHYRFRGELIDRLEHDVLGPSGDEDEVITEAPATAYITGVLFPRRRPYLESGRFAAAEDRPEDDFEVGALERDDDPAPALFEVDEQPETGVSLANLRRPSAMGLTLSVDSTSTAQLIVELDMAVYDPIDQNGEVVQARRVESRSIEDGALRWRRRPLSVSAVPVPVTPGLVNFQRDDATAGLGTSVEVPDFPPGLQMRTRVRDANDEGIVSITFSLVNTKEVGQGALIDADCFFQPRIRVTAPKNGRSFIERPATSGADELDLEVSRLVHRHAPRFATGHGCAADWNWTPPRPRGPRGTGPARTDAIWTTFVPRYEVLLMQSNPDVEEPSMLALADEKARDRTISTLTQMVAGYRAWIKDRESEAAVVDEPLRQTALAQIQACADACDRIENGIALLARDEDAFEAFRLACEAMAMQRARAEWIRSGRCGQPDLSAARWRPFQIGFVLLCLEGIVDPDHADRRMADLLWFPTGGGKTEAYLGLIAFTIFHRRLNLGARRGGGVTVLMRYTLRLLTLQQFERAAALICAMEDIRLRDQARLGNEHISIGMWVGQAATPNRLEDAADALAKLRDGTVLQTKNPVQLKTCPWCGTPIDAHDYNVDTKEKSMEITCRDPDCTFHTGLPVHVVDEAIYQVRPSLIIATSDKFAQIAWREDVAALFNLKDAPVGTPPPELVIQDELHLISGPLGSLAGLYESAIDLAAQGPKVIASTATIRQAGEQGKRLFDRIVQQFPPAGLDARDSWFAVEADRTAKAARAYVGLLTPSTSQATLLIRAYAALLHHGRVLDGTDSVRDAYWTLVGYFNSLRLLAAAELQTRSDIEERLKQLAAREGKPPRTVEVLREITSRAASSDIPDLLGELFRALPDQAAIDVVLATNMISVGVDVDRLGLMTVTGQPQTTAEYIQATSRVGRRYPGLVVTLLNSTRSRDRSHYEDFVSYHSALYRQVESTSVTPFAARARDRALHAVLVGLARLTEPKARSNDAARDVESFLNQIRALRDGMVMRVTAIAPNEAGQTAKELDTFIEYWRSLAAKNPRLVYEADRKRFPGDRRQSDAALLGAYGMDDDLSESFETMWSLRDVDTECGLYLEG